jgi:nucleoside-diphosphate-sugar epimerase
VALENLVDFIARCADIEKSPDAANQVFLISDNEDISTPELITRIARAYGKKPRLITVPVSWMSFAARLLGKQDVTRRLFGSLQVDCTKARELLGWEPVVTIDEQLSKIADSQ